MKNNIGIENTTLVRDARNARRAAEEVQPAQQKLRHERLRRWERTARSAEQNMEGTASRNAGLDKHIQPDEHNGASKGARATRASAAAVRFRGVGAVH